MADTGARELERAEEVPLNVDEAVPERRAHNLRLTRASHVLPDQLSRQCLLSSLSIAFALCLIGAVIGTGMVGGQVLKGTAGASSSAGLVELASERGRVVRAGDTVYLKTHTGKVLDVEGDKTQLARARWDRTEAWQALIIQKKAGGVVRSGDAIALQAHTGNMIDVGKGVTVKARWPQVGQWQSLYIYNEAGGPIRYGDKLYIKAHNGKYIDVQGDHLGRARARWSEKGKWQAFKLLKGPSRVPESTAFEWRYDADTGKALKAKPEPKPTTTAVKPSGPVYPLESDWRTWKHKWLDNRQNEAWMMQSALTTAPPTATITTTLSSTMTETLTTTLMTTTPKMIGDSGISVEKYRHLLGHRRPVAAVQLAVRGLPSATQAVANADLPAKLAKELAQAMGIHSESVLDMLDRPNSVSLLSSGSDGSATGALLLNCRIRLPLGRSIEDVATLLHEPAFRTQIAQRAGSGNSEDVAPSIMPSARSVQVGVAPSGEDGFAQLAQIDGVLRPGEFLTAASTLLDPPLQRKQAVDLFHALDIDGDGQLTAHEFFATSYYRDSLPGAVAEDAFVNSEDSLMPAPSGQAAGATGAGSSMFVDGVKSRLHDIYLTDEAAWRALDSDSDGLLSLSELLAGSTMFNPPLTQGEAVRFFDALDKDHSARIDQNEFMNPGTMSNTAVGFA